MYCQDITLPWHHFYETHFSLDQAVCGEEEFFGFFGAFTKDNTSEFKPNVLSTLEVFVILLLAPELCLYSTCYFNFFVFFRHWMTDFILRNFKKMAGSKNPGMKANEVGYLSFICLLCCHLSKIARAHGLADKKSGLVLMKSILMSSWTLTDLAVKYSWYYDRLTISKITFNCKSNTYRTNMNHWIEICATINNFRLRHTDLDHLKRQMEHRKHWLEEICSSAKPE